MHGVVNMNELTERLLAEGYTKDNHPESVQWNGFREFEYTFRHLKSLVWESPCGLLSDSRDVTCMGYMSFMGIDWRAENNNPTFNCPFKKLGCELNHEALKNRKTWGMVHCALHLTDKTYDYKNSFEKLWDEFEERMKQERIALYRRMKGYRQEIEGYGYCNCFIWDSNKDRWRVRYDPLVCARGCGYINNICLLTGREIDRNKKANVFYDLKVIRTRREGGLFDGEKIVSITKGKKVFSSPTPMMICEEYARRCKKDILDRERGNLHHELWHTDTEIETLNVRAERRESRDLLQDLQDMQEGLEVIHASDQIKAKAQAKRERKLKREEAKQRKFERSNIEKMKQWIKGDNHNLKRHAERELKKHGIEIYEQVSLFEESDAL